MEMYHGEARTTNHAGHSVVGRTETQIETESGMTTIRTTNPLGGTRGAEIKEVAIEGVIIHPTTSVATDQITVHAEEMMIRGGGMDGMIEIVTNPGAGTIGEAVGVVIIRIMTIDLAETHEIDTANMTTIGVVTGIVAAAGEDLTGTVMMMIDDPDDAARVTAKIGRRPLAHC